MFGKIRAGIYSMRANLAYSNGRTEETLRLLEKSYLTKKARPEVVSYYGFILLKCGKLELAAKILEEQLASKGLSETDRNTAQANYALVLWKQGKLEAAISLYEEIFPRYKNTSVYGSLGYLYNLKGDLEKALHFNLEAYEYNKSGQVILDNLGQTYYLMGNYEKAEETYKRLMELKPQFPEAYYDYALVLEELGDKAKSLDMLKSALSYNLNYLSEVTRDDIDGKIAQLEAKSSGVE